MNESKWFWWVVAWGINACWLAIAAATANVFMAIGAGVYTIILFLWELPNTTIDDD